MPQKRKPPRLWLRTEKGGKAGKTSRTWVIIDGSRQIRTGCLEAQVDEANRHLEAYLNAKYEPVRDNTPDTVAIADVLLIYLEDKVESLSRPGEARAAIIRLNDFFGDRMLSAIKSKLCREFSAWRQTASGARRDLEVLRSAINHYHKEHQLTAVPTITLPPKSLPRERYLTRSEAAALLWAAMGWEKHGDGANAYWTRRRDQKRDHLARLILIGIYTGTRLGAMLDLQWMRNTTGGYADLENGVLYRRAEGERVAHNKRKTPVKMARRLQAHMRRWKKLDGWTTESEGVRHIIHYQGAAVTKPHKAFRSARAAAGLGEDVTPHILRHTRGTWLAQAGVNATEAAASLGLTQAEYERTYLHNDPSFQEGAAEAY